MSTDNVACLAWLADTLQKLRQEGRTKAVGYLEAVLDEVVFEMNMSAWSWVNDAVPLPGLEHMLTSERRWSIAVGQHNAKE